MRGIQRLELINDIARELQARFVTTDINAYFDGHSLEHPGDIVVSSKWTYSKAVLSKAPDAKLLEIAEDLGVGVPAAVVGSTLPPRLWGDGSRFRLFVSHISKNKDKATRLRDCLTPYGIAAFVAHEDIEPTLEWQTQIERALHAMDAFLAMHTRGFAASNWTQQEVGFAVAKDVKIISLEMGEIPTGFISKQQALPRRNRRAEEIADEVVSLLRADSRTRQRFLDCSSAVDVPF
jgi:TIR domain